MLRTLFRRLALAASLVVLLPVALSSIAPVTSAQSQAATGTLSIYSVYTADGNNNNKTVFQVGNSIHYIVGVNNTSGSSITAEIQFTAFWGRVKADQVNNGYNGTIFNGGPYTVTLPAGKSGQYSPSTIPANATPGQYTYSVSVWEAANQTNSATSAAAFYVTGTKYALDKNGNVVPWYSQWWSTDGLSKYDSGPASVAMARAFYGAFPSGLTPTQKINYVRQFLINTYGEKQEPNGRELDYALQDNLDGSFDNVYHYSIWQSGCCGFSTPSNQESDLATAIAQNNPAVELVNGQVFGRSYARHWVVVMGFYCCDSNNNTYVIVNDPDDTKSSKGYVGGKAIKILLNTFGIAILNVPSDPNNIDGIVAYV